MACIFDLGINGEEVEGRLLPKSHGSGKTFPGPQALKTIDSVQHWLNQLCEELNERLNSDLDQNKRIAQTLTLHARAYKTGDSDSLRKFPSKSCPLRYGTRKIQEDALILFQAGLRDFLGSYSSKVHGNENSNWGVTSLSLSASKIVSIPSGTHSIAKYFGGQFPSSSSTSNPSIDVVIDEAVPSSPSGNENCTAMVPYDLQLQHPHYTEMKHSSACLDPQVIRSYASNRTWVIGFLVDIFGALLMLRALSLAPVSVIQPVSGCGLAILSIFSHFYLKEVMNAVDWVGITLAGFGTIGVGAGGEKHEVVALSIFRIPALAFVVFILFVEKVVQILLNGWVRICKSQRREQEMMEYDVVEEIIYGLESGILFGMSSVISKMGFLFLDQGILKSTFIYYYHKNRYTLEACHGGKLTCFEPLRSLSKPNTRSKAWEGRAIVVSTCAAVASILTGVLAGMFALGERLPSEPKARLALLLGWLLIIVGVILLVGSTRLVRFLSCSSRQRRSNVDKNFGLRRTTSSRVREPSPSAIIQAATLNHLLSSSSKEKA
ncbi:DNA polymerase eta subunit [Vigna unguiculata]|uniref:DNA polymerase eta subunit n=1 Tax=Vigna unguiculata TaxID=3917 RepID=A0A4D6MGM5_VIGUN|nr:DNA polymerase eta subunit [Vigna unguiculata]